MGGLIVSGLMGGGRFLPRPYVSLARNIEVLSR